MKNIFYISFATPGAFLGQTFVEAETIEEAQRKTNEFGVNPGGEMLLLPFKTADEVWLNQYLNKLTKLKEDVEAIQQSEDLIQIENEEYIICEEHNKRCLN